MDKKKERQRIFVEFLEPYITPIFTTIYNLCKDKDKIKKNLKFMRKLWVEAFS
jgi:hypothetical protein